MLDSEADREKFRAIYARCFALMMYTALMVLMLALSTTANAQVYAGKVTPTLTFSGTTANCSVVVYEVGAEIEAALELWCGTTHVAYWHDTATSKLDMSKHHVVISGNTYVLTVRGTIDGETFTGASEELTCPQRM